MGRTWYNHGIPWLLSHVATMTLPRPFLEPPIRCFTRPLWAEKNWEPALSSPRKGPGKPEQNESDGWYLEASSTDFPTNSCRLSRTQPPKLPSQWWKSCLEAWDIGVSINGGIQKWLVYNGKSHSNGWFGGTPNRGVAYFHTNSNHATGPLQRWLSPKLHRLHTCDLHYMVSRPGLLYLGSISV